MELPAYERSQQLALAGGALMIAGAALPWTSASDVVAFVLRGDQFVALLAGISVVGIVVVREWTMLEWFGVALFGAITAYFGARALHLLFQAGYGVGPGLLVQLAGGVLALVAGGLATQESHGTTSDVAEDDWEDGDDDPEA